MKGNPQIHQVVPIEELELEVSTTKETITFCFIGNKDAVRLAARNVVYGLGLEPEIEHYSEILIMNGKLEPGDKAQINLIFQMNERAPLVFMFRYLARLEYSLACIAGNSAYLHSIKNEAELNRSSMFLNPYALSFNHCFWLTEELEKEASIYCGKMKHPAIQAGFFSEASSSNGTRRFTLLNNTEKNIITTVAAMISRNPLNNNPVTHSKSLALTCLTNYFSLQHSPLAYDIHEDKENIFFLIRPDDRQAFFQLAETYTIVHKERLTLVKYEAELDEESAPCQCVLL